MFGQVVEAPVKSPSSCKGCFVGSLGADRKWWLDTGTIEEFYGRVYYCDKCFTELANLVGFFSPEQVTDLREKLANAEEQVRQLEEYYDAARAFGVDLRAIYTLYKDTNVHLKGSEDRIDALVQRASDAGQSTSEQRPDDVPNVKSKRVRLEPL